MSFLAETRGLFDSLADAAFSELKEGEELSLQLIAEDQTYVRFNNSRVRQATGVLQRNLTLTFQAAGRKTAFSFDLTGDPAKDLAAVRCWLDRARQEVQVLPADSFIVSMQNHGQSEEVYSGRLPDVGEVIDGVAHVTQGTEFTGLFATGPQVRAVRNSQGLHHWFSRETFFIDYSLFTTSDSGDHKAVKGRSTDTTWDLDAFLASLSANKHLLNLLKRPSRAVPPGEYRVYFAPAAVAELISMLSWGAVSYKAWKAGHCAMKKLIDGEVRLSDQFTLKENFALALTPRFNSLGELPPEELTVIEWGVMQNLLVSARSAMEYGVVSNAADPGGWFGEHLRAAEILPGNLPEGDVLKHLDTGLYVSNLHYLNWSDLQTARLTGMTRYACFWVENGEIVSPIADLRFDDSLYRLFGSALEALTTESHLHPAIDTYYHRALGGSKTPGALVGACRFTL